MIIGVPRERKTLEKRVALTPDGAHELIRRGHEVVIETNAGAGSFFDDDAYKTEGCKIVPTLKEVWNIAELIVKVKEPHEDEYEFFRPDLAIFDYLHLAGLPKVADAMLKGGVTGIAYELVTNEAGQLPLLEPMSEVAGKLSVLVGSYFLLAQNEGRGLLIGGTVGVPPADVVIVGAGVAGRAALSAALGMGARVTVLDINYNALARVKLEFGDRPRTVHSTSRNLVEACSRADLLVGAVLVPGAKAPRIITRDMIKAMPAGSVFVDISIDQGGCAETIRPTSLDDPIYKEEGVIHYAVQNMPSQTARTSTRALAAATLPYIVKIADAGVVPALKKYPKLGAALCTHQGKLTNELVGEAVGVKSVSVESVIG